MGMKKGFTLVEVSILFVIFLIVAFLVAPLSLDDTLQAKNTSRWRSVQSDFMNIFYDANVIYEAGTIFSRSNNTSQEINFNYNTASTTKQQFSFNLSGTLAMKTSGKIDVVSASLDKSIRSDIGLKSDISFEEEMDFTIKIRINPEQGKAGPGHRSPGDNTPYPT